MARIFRSILAVLLPLILAGIVISLVEATGHRFYPPPEGLDTTDLKALREAMADMPVGALLFVLVAWTLGSFLGGWLAARVADRARTAHALTVGGLLMAGGLSNLILIPHPAWFWVLGLLTFLPMAYVGALLSQWPSDRRQQP